MAMPANCTLIASSQGIPYKAKPGTAVYQRQVQENREHPRQNRETWSFWASQSSHWLAKEATPETDHPVPQEHHPDPSLKLLRLTLLFPTYLPVFLHCFFHAEV